MGKRSEYDRSFLGTVPWTYVIVSAVFIACALFPAYAFWASTDVNRLADRLSGHWTGSGRTTLFIDQQDPMGLLWSGHDHLDVSGILEGRRLRLTAKIPVFPPWAKRAHFALAGERWTLAPAASGLLVLTNGTRTVLLTPL
jgi:hypothetical protein